MGQCLITRIFNHINILLLTGWVLGKRTLGGGNWRGRVGEAINKIE